MLTGVEIGIGIGGVGLGILECSEEGGRQAVLVEAGVLGEETGWSIVFFLWKDSFVCEFLVKMKDRLSISGCSVRS